MTRVKPSNESNPVDRLALLLSLATGAAGCDSVDPGGSGSGSGGCALTMTYQGEICNGVSARVAPMEGGRVGQGILPACNDTGGASEQDEIIELAEIRGVSPSVALAWRGRGDTVLVHEDVDDDQLPPSVTRLLRTPECDQDDEPIELSGPWLGILGADAKTELDLVPPYDLDIYVEASSHTRYERAYLTVRVPPELGCPLSRSDVRTSLWEGGGISLTVGCRNGRYPADQVAAHPPA